MLWECYRSVLVAGTLRLSALLGRLGFFVAKRPVLVLVSTLVLSIALCTGLFVELEEESDAEDLWYGWVGGVGVLVVWAGGCCLLEK